VTTALKAKNKLGFIDGTLERPRAEDDKEFSECHAWDIANSMLCFWLLNVINPKLKMTIAYCDTAKSMWDDLRKRYGMANAPKIHQLKANIEHCKQRDMDVGEFYSKLINLWNELNNLVKLPVCTCASCMCGVTRRIMAKYEEDKAHPFWMGLNDMMPIRPSRAKFLQLTLCHLLIEFSTLHSKRRITRKL